MVPEHPLTLPPAPPYGVLWVLRDMGVQTLARVPAVHGGEHIW